MPPRRRAAGSSSASYTAPRWRPVHPAQATGRPSSRGVRTARAAGATGTAPATGRRRAAAQRSNSSAGSARVASVSGQAAASCWTAARSAGTSRGCNAPAPLPLARAEVGIRRGKLAVAVLGDDAGIEATPHVEHAGDARPAGIDGFDEIGQDAVHHVLMESALIAEVPEVELEGFQLHAARPRHIFQHNR